nr:putative phospholipid:diacylglycerol acyltransferase 2 [Ipomoea batatas]
MGSILRFRKLCYVEAVKCSSGKRNGDEKKRENVEKVGKKQQRKEGRCIDSCCRVIGYLCTTWWLLLFLGNFLPKAPADSPGARLKREGLTGFHPVVLVPGIVTGGLELWEGRPCAQGLFRKRLWGGSFAQMFKRPLCWLEHLSLDNETGLDPPGIRVRAVPGLVAADYFAPGYFVWAVLIENLARIGYEQKNMYMAAYDWRLSFQNTEVEATLMHLLVIGSKQVRDQALSRLKSKIELMYATNGNKKVVVVPHSMGVLYFLHFLKWVESPPPMGGGGGPSWCAKHIKAIMNVGPAFLGVPKSFSSILSAEGKDISFIRSMAPGLFDETFRFQTMEHVMRVSQTWDSVVSLIPKGGETVWGNLDWSPEEEYNCSSVTKKYQLTSILSNSNKTDLRSSQIKAATNYGRIISFGKASSELHSSQLSAFDATEDVHQSVPNNRCGGVWTEYNQMSKESVQKVAENKAYTAKTAIDLLRFVAPNMMKRAESHFSHGIADDLDDPKYKHYKYWSNPLETKLPIAPDMEIYCLYGVGIPTERSYLYKLSPSSDRCNTNIPFQIDSSVAGSDHNDRGCLRGGVHFVDGDGSVPLLSAGFVCAKPWQGTTRFNPSGIPTYIREYQHKPPSSLLEGRGTQSGAHVDIMGNVAFIEDVLRVAAGSSGAQLGGNRVHSDIMKMSERINIRL